MNAVCFAVSMGHELRSGLAGWSWFGASQEVVEMMLTGRYDGTSGSLRNGSPSLAVHRPGAWRQRGLRSLPRGLFHGLLRPHVAANLSLNEEPSVSKPTGSHFFFPMTTHQKSHGISSAPFPSSKENHQVQPRFRGRN